MSFEPAPVLGLLYDATLNPNLWPEALNALADEVGGYANVLTKVNIWDLTGDWIGNRGDPDVMRQYFAYFSLRNPLHAIASPQEYIRDWKSTVLLDESLVDKELLLRSEFYNDWMNPNGMHSVMMIRLSLENDQLAVVNINRAKNRGQFTSDHLRKARVYHPHLMRAFRLAGDLEKASAASGALDNALDQLSAAVFVLDHNGRIRHLNRGAEMILRTWTALTIEAGALRATDPAVDRRLSQLVRTAARQDDSVSRGGRMQVQLNADRVFTTLTVAPINSPRLSIFGSGPGVLITALSPPPTSDAIVHKLATLYGLTPHEARLALRIREGSSLSEIARTSGRSLNTLKAQLNSIFTKMGVHRQVDLVRTVIGLSQVD